VTTTFKGLDGIADAVGSELGPTEWLSITQHRIDLFVDATDDRQWIHVDPTRAANGPFGSRPLDELVSAPVVARMRRLRLALMVGGAIGLIPWIVFWVITLPANYVALGFDVLVVAFMVATAVLVFLRRELMLLTAFTTGVLLISDAWFDVMTAGPHDLWVSALTATLVELPLAVILIRAALRIFAADRDAVVAARSRDATVAVATAAVVEMQSHHMVAPTMLSTDPLSSTGLRVRRKSLVTCRGFEARNPPVAWHGEPISSRSLA